MSAREMFMSKVAVDGTGETIFCQPFPVRFWGHNPAKSLQKVCKKSAGLQGSCRVLADFSQTFRRLFADFCTCLVFFIHFQAYLIRKTSIKENEHRFFTYRQTIEILNKILIMTLIFLLLFIIVWNPDFPPSTSGIRTFFRVFLGPWLSCDDVA